MNKPIKVKLDIGEVYLRKIDPPPVPTQHCGVTGKDCVCSHCAAKVEFVFCQDSGNAVGLACPSCKVFWPLVLPRG